MGVNSYILRIILVITSCRRRRLADGDALCSSVGVLVREHIL